jgi:hypothetical protein
MAKSEALAALIKRAEEIAANQGKPFATTVRQKAPPGDPRFIGPVEPIGPNQITPQTRIGPPERQGPPEMQGPRQITPETLIGPPERQGPQLPFRTNVRLKAPPETGTGFTMIDTPSQGFTMSPPNRAVAMRDIGSEAASSPGTSLATVNPRSYSPPPRRLDDIWNAEFKEIRQPVTPWATVSDADNLAFRTVRPQTLSREELLAMRGPEPTPMSAGRPYSGSNLPLFAGTTLAGTALLSGGQQAVDDAQRRQFLEALNGREPDHLDPNLFGVQYPKAGMDRGNALGVDELSAYPAGAVHRGMDRNNAPGVDELSAYPRNTVQLAKQHMSTIAPQQRAPIDLTSGQSTRPSSGGLASLFSGKDYQSKGGELRQDGKINWGDSDNAADFFRASKALQETPDASGMSTGGAAKPHKDAALHKALDIIAHMLGRH